VADHKDLPVRWSQTENVRWSVKLPGWGTSSPVVYGDRVFVTSQLTEGGKRSLLTLCLDRKDGKELWRHDFGFGFDQRTHQKSNFAVNTPAVTSEAVYLSCRPATQEQSPAITPVWSTNRQGKTARYHDNWSPRAMRKTTTAAAAEAGIVPITRRNSDNFIPK
jgi:outer membrane protein assembly factor BamB